jgi:hypothetical protein
MTTRETLIFACLRGHKWESVRFTDSFHPQQADCPTCGMTSAFVSGSMTERNAIVEDRPVGTLSYACGCTYQSTTEFSHYYDDNCASCHVHNWTRKPANQPTSRG